MALLLILLYFVPTVVALSRRVRNAGSVVVIDVFLGWTLIGWVVALAMALRDDTNPRLPDSPKTTGLGEYQPPKL